MASPANNNFDPKANHDVQIYATSIIFISLSVIAVILRLISSRMRHQKLRADDYLVIAAMLFELATCIHICVGVKAYGIGRHSATLTQDQLVGYFKMVYLSGLFQPCTLVLTKMAILILYRRIFVTRAFRLLTNITAGVVILWWICDFFPDALICLPVPKYWNPDLPGYCGNLHLLTILSPIPWIVTDLAILLMPIPMVAKLHMPLNQRVALGGVFLLGGFALVSSIIRYSTVFYSAKDLTYSETGIVIWSVIESATAVISACLVVMKPIFVILVRVCSRRSSKERPPDDQANEGDSLQQHRRDLLPSLVGPMLYSRDAPTMHTTISNTTTLGQNGADKEKIVGSLWEQARSESEPHGIEVRQEVCVNEGILRRDGSPP